MGTVRRVYTTGQIARILCCAPRTVSKLIDAGEMAGYRLPGSMDRRVTRASLIRFMRQKGIPLLDQIEVCAGDSVLVVGLKDGRRLAEALPGASAYVVETLFAAGAEFYRQAPQFVVMDFDLGKQDVLKVLASMRGESEAPVYVVGVFGEDEPEPESYTALGYVNEAWKRPFAVESLARRLSELMVLEERDES